MYYYYYYFRSELKYMVFLEYSIVFYLLLHIWPVNVASETTNRLYIKHIKYNKINTTQRKNGYRFAPSTNYFHQNRILFYEGRSDIRFNYCLMFHVFQMLAGAHPCTYCVSCESPAKKWCFNTLVGTCLHLYPPLGALVNQLCPDTPR